MSVKHPPLDEVDLARAVELVGLELAQIRELVVEVEQTLFGWLASAEMSDSIPTELHKLDFAVQLIGEMADFSESIGKAVPSDTSVSARDAIEQIRLKELRDRIFCELSGVAASRVTEEITEPTVELF